jgi:hypothetical protein
MGKLYIDIHYTLTVTKRKIPKSMGFPFGNDQSWGGLPGHWPATSERWLGIDVAEPAPPEFVKENSMVNQSPSHG